MNRRQLLAGCALLCAAPTTLHAASAPTRFKVTVTGKGPDVVLIPGLGSSAAVWDGTVAQLKATHRVHAIQVAGFAGAPAGPNASGEILGPLVDELAAYIAAETKAPPAIIGHSLGGLTTNLISIRHPSAVSRAMIVDSLPFLGLLMNPMMTVGFMRPQAERQRDLMIATAPESWPAMARAQSATLAASPQGRALAGDWGAASDRVVFARAMYEVMVTDIRPELPRIRTPTTILIPRADGGRDMYATAYAGLSGLRIVEVPESRHFIMLDQPQAFAKAVSDWLA